MWALLYIYLAVGLILLVRTGIGQHIVNGFRLLVFEHFACPGLRPKFQSIFIGLPAVLFGCIMAICLYPVMLYTRRRQRTVLPARVLPLQKPGTTLNFPPIHYN